MTHTTQDNQQFEVPTGLHLHPRRDDAFRCDDCGNWADAGDCIRHSSRCDTETLQATEMLTAHAAPSLSKGLTIADLGDVRRSAVAGTLHRDYGVDDVVEAVQAGALTWSDAMNQDM